MIAILLIAGVATWLWVGFLTAKHLLWRQLGRPATRYPAVALFALIWLVGPWIDEYLGAKEFDRLCKAMPDLEFRGPVSIGEGPFFDAQGAPKWSNQREFETIVYGEDIRSSKKPFGTSWKRNLWKEMFPRSEQNARIADWPIPVIEQKLTYTFRPTGQVVLVSTWRGSPGGWLKRITGWGNHSSYQCGKRTPYPQEEKWIKF